MGEGGTPQVDDTAVEVLEVARFEPPPWCSIRHAAVIRATSVQVLAQGQWQLP
jgi:hypothetical protein